MNSRSYPADSSALILVDVLNDFLAEEGKLNGMIRPMLDELALIPTLERLVSVARESRLTIVYAPHGLDKHSFDDIKHLHPRMQMALDNQVFWKGSQGADFYPSLQPQPGDVIVSRHRMFNSFNGTDLDEQLKRRRIEKIMLAGLTSHTCIEGTGRHAIEAGQSIAFPKRSMRLVPPVGQRFHAETRSAAIRNESIRASALCRLM